MVTRGEDSADYTYVVKEDPHNLGQWYLECSPNTRELSCITDDTQLRLQLRPGITYEEAQRVRRFVQENVPVIKLAHFRRR